MRENLYQPRVIKRLQREFPGCWIIINDTSQGMPDLLILFGIRWAMLEVKASESSAVRPNQTHFVGLFNEMSYASFINPSNEEAVFGELHEAIGQPDRR